MIEKKEFKIKINEKVSEISNENLIKIFTQIYAFKKLEKKKGNEYDKAWLKIKYKKNMIISEYINIFNLIRLPDLYTFIKYFKTIEERFNDQGIDTKIDLQDYLEETIEISQEIIIIMVFNIETHLEELEKESKKLLELMKITKSNEEIFEIIQKDLHG